MSNILPSNSTTGTTKNVTNFLATPCDCTFETRNQQMILVRAIILIYSFNAQLNTASH